MLLQWGFPLPPSHQSPAEETPLMATDDVHISDLHEDPFAPGTPPRHMIFPQADGIVALPIVERPGMLRRQGMISGSSNSSVEAANSWGSICPSMRCGGWRSCSTLVWIRQNHQRWTSRRRPRRIRFFRHNASVPFPAAPCIRPSRSGAFLHPLVPRANLPRPVRTDNHRVGVGLTRQKALRCSKLPSYPSRSAF